MWNFRSSDRNWLNFIISPNPWIGHFVFDVTKIVSLWVTSWAQCSSELNYWNSLKPRVISSCIPKKRDLIKCNKISKIVHTLKNIHIYLINTSFVGSVLFLTSLKPFNVWTALVRMTMKKLVSPHELNWDRFSTWTKLWQSLSQLRPSKELVLKYSSK